LRGKTFTPIAENGDPREKKAQVISDRATAKVVVTLVCREPVSPSNTAEGNLDWKSRVQNPASRACFHDDAAQFFDKSTRLATEGKTRPKSQVGSGLQRNPDFSIS
jgi:hypothetical protein